MKISRYSFALFLFAIPFLFSCKKESGTEKVSDYYVKFKMNGKWETYNIAVGELGPDLMDESKTNFDITSSNDDNTKSFRIGIQVDGPQIATGVYDSTNSITIVSYSIVSPFVDYTGGSFYGFGGSKYTLTITSITDKTLSGHFTGNHVVNFMDETDRIEITEGEFKALRIR